MCKQKRSTVQPASKTCEEITLIVLCKKWSLRISFRVSIVIHVGYKLAIYDMAVSRLSIVGVT